MGEEKGEVLLFGNATAAFGYAGMTGDLVHLVHKATLRHEFCRAIDTDEALKILTESS